MTEHASKTQLERFCISGLPEEQLVSVANHLAACETCHRELADTLRSYRGTEGISFTLAPEFWLRHEHLDYERLVEVAENKLDATDREIVDIHLSVCPTCREDLRSFLAFRKQIEPELLVRYGPSSPKPRRDEFRLWNWFRAFVWRQVYVAAILILAIAVVSALVILKRRAATLEASRPPLPSNNAVTEQRPTPESGAASDRLASPTPVPLNDSMRPNPSPVLTVKNKPLVGTRTKTLTPIALNDVGGRTVTIDHAGTISGLDDVVPATRDEIAKALTEKIDAPEILTRLSGTNTILRGPNGGLPFKLRSPTRSVLLTDRPSFEWDKLAGATGYRVYVGDLKGHEVAKSKELSSDQTRWRPAAPLPRGEIYSWAVAAVVDGKEVMSPGAAEPEMKFQVLAASDLQTLNQLKRSRSHLVLAVFYVKVGLLAEGERELRELIRLNPRSDAPKTLLRSVHSMRSAP